MSKINVFITVDTEHSIGGAFRDPRLKPVGNEKRIFGKIRNKYYGIPLIMDIANEYGIPLTFFVEVMNKYYFGPDETRKVVEYILNRGHDVQLHVHPGYLNFTLDDPTQLRFSDLIGEYNFKRQLEIIEEARNTLIDYGVQDLKAFRAGCFGANELTLEALKQTGFVVDSSYNAAYLNGSCLFHRKGINDIVQINGIVELPITNFLEKSYMRRSRLMPLDINGVSFREMRSVLRYALNDGFASVMIILHSFSFIKAYDVQYRKVRPRGYVIRRYRKLCEYLALDSRFKPANMKQIGEMNLNFFNEGESARIPTVSPILSICRGLVQLGDEIF